MSVNLGTVTYCTDGATSKTTNQKSSSASILGESIKLYPNPASQDLFIDFIGYDNKATLYIHSITGQLVKSLKINHGAKQKISTNKMAEGLYFFRVIDDSGKLLKTDRIILKNK